MYLKKMNIIILCLSVIFFSQSFFSETFAGEIDAKFLKFMLSDQDVPEYRKGGTTQRRWPVGPDILGYCLDQVWVSNNGNSEAVLDFAIYDSEEAAIRGMYYYTHTTAEPWVWGSLDGGITGLNSWRSFNHDNSVLFAYGNIGILIGRYRGDDQDMIPVLARAQMEMIDRNLAPEIIAYRETLRESRLSPSDYDKYRAEAVNVDLSGFTKISDGDSLWLMKDEGVKMGIRREWEDEKGRVVGIDICKLESNETAEKIASERAKMSNGKTVAEFSPIPWDSARLSEVLIRGNVTVHLYYFNHNKTFEPAVTPPYSPPPPYGPPVPISYLYPYPYNTYSTYLGIAPYFQPLPVRLSASSFNNPFVSYPYSLSVYNTVPPWTFQGGTASFDAGLVNRYDIPYSPYPVNYFPWKYYPFATSNIPMYNSNFYSYGFFPIYR